MMLLHGFGRGVMALAVCGVVLWQIGAMGQGSGVSEEKSQDGGVKLTVDGGKAILDNGIIVATINTGGAAVTSLKYDGKEMMGVVYFSMGGGGNYETPYNCVYSVTTQTAEMVDISCKRVYEPGKNKHAWDIDVHFVLRKGMSGLYSYAIVEHKEGYPEQGMGEWRTVYKMPGLFERIYVDDIRQWEMPSGEDWKKSERTSIGEVAKLTTGPRAGKYDCKYEYAAEYWTVGAYGHASNVNNIGAWMIPGVCDWLNDGPMKADLAPAAGIIHLHLISNHFGGSGFHLKQGEAWKKIYGPWLMYFNNKKGADACWADAKKQAQIEQAAYPYSWMSNELYQAGERVTVKGKFIAQDALKPNLSTEGAWVGLALPEKEAGVSWQYQAKAYQYWAQAGKDGSFAIRGVRPGAYTLYAFTKGAVGEFSKDNVTVKANTPLDLGEVTWNVTHSGKTIAWEIGVPDRLPAEFRHGSTDYWEPFLYEQFVKEFPNPIEYNVADKNWATALNYVQNVYDGKAWKWRLNFELAKAPAGDATLTLAFAGSDRMRLKVYSNDETKEVATVTPPNSGGNGLVREAQHMRYGLSYVKIPAGMLKAGKNVITLEGASSSARSCYVSYDYINLELPDTKL
jgi:rhamnogalacturonan endolyase